MGTRALFLLANIKKHLPAWHQLIIDNFIQVELSFSQTSLREHELVSWILCLFIANDFCLYSALSTWGLAVVSMSLSAETSVFCDSRSWIAFCSLRVSWESLLVFLSGYWCTQWRRFARFLGCQNFWLVAPLSQFQLYSASASSQLCASLTGSFAWTLNWNASLSITTGAFPLLSPFSKWVDLVTVWLGSFSESTFKLAISSVWRQVRCCILLRLCSLGTVFLLKVR